MTKPLSQDAASSARVVQVRDEMRRLGFPIDTATWQWVPAALVESGIIDADRCDRPSLDIVLRCSSQIWNRTQSLDAAITGMVGALGWPESIGDMIENAHHFAPREARDRFFAICRDHGVRFNIGLSQLAGTREGDFPLAFILAEQGLLDPRGFLNVRPLIERWTAHDSHLSIREKKPSSSKKWFDLQSPESWTQVSHHAFLDTLEAAIDRMSEADAVKCLVGGAQFVALHVRRCGKDPEQYTVRYNEANQRVAQLACRHLGPDGARATTAIRQAALLCATHALEKGVDLGPASQLALRQAAGIELASMRTILARAHEPEAAVEFKRLRDVWFSCSLALFENVRLWDAVRPYLLAFRSLSAPSVTPGLRYWHSLRRQDKADQPPQPWCQVPDTLAVCFHDSARKEEELDEAMIDLRTRFADFCLSRLRSRKDSDTPIEPDPVWRKAYIAAALELKINPMNINHNKGRGHHTLYHASHRDPDAGVRKAAHGAYAIMRRSPELGDQSPRKAFFHAFWHLRWAHMESLGLQVDRAAAEATRQREVRRTTSGFFGPDEDEINESEYAYRVRARREDTTRED